MQKFKIGLVCWWSNNYGNMATNYALFSFLRDSGYSVLMIDNMEHENLLPNISIFNKEHYALSSQYFKYGELEPINEICDQFIVGSDQLWNYEYSWKFGYGLWNHLDFVKCEKLKISYASSFGQEKDSSPISQLISYIFLYKRFDALSVREESGKKILKEKFKVDAQCVVDPVYICDKKNYTDLIQNSQIEINKRYLLIYILNPNLEKMNFAKKIANEKNLEIITISDLNPQINMDVDNKKMYINERCNIELQDWLKLIYNASFIFTDSFHGTCFSTIFHKEFLSVINRQSDRFELFIKCNELGDRVINRERLATYEINNLKTINYNIVDKYFDDKIYFSKKWLIGSLEKKDRTKLSYNILLDDELRKYKFAEHYNAEIEKRESHIREKAEFFESQYTNILKEIEWLKEQNRNIENSKIWIEEQNKNLEKRNKWLEEQNKNLENHNKWLEEQKENHEEYIRDLEEGNKWLNEQRLEHESYISELMNKK